MNDGTGGNWLAGSILLLLALIAVIGVLMSRKPPKK